MGWGFEIDEHHFEVHRFHPPLIYGRRGGPDDGLGVALARIKPNHPKGDESMWLLLITYDLPVLSAKAVPQMVKFSEKYCKPVSEVSGRLDRRSMILYLLLDNSLLYLIRGSHSLFLLRR